ncbi:hypothetical protein SAMN05216466_10652 [Paraburkholderia phenazinium]|uniref:Uncharacterized protein n=1 Tax=Paraburkholderia phenazinium TaxID=60549 RepID=A0A1G7Y624_9BURK|nr:hypothetical protein [Paraburkholderia phenazinium]SDG91922.1 hypothetical protein SAMN05216466_10652 [Paraburkholderia phenazinium]
MTTNSAQRLPDGTYAIQVYVLATNADGKMQFHLTCLRGVPEADLLDEKHHLAAVESAHKAGLTGTFTVFDQNEPAAAQLAVLARHQQMAGGPLLDPSLYVDADWPA